MLLSPHADLMERARPISLHGLSKDAWKRYSAEGFQHYLVEQPGFKYNMNDIQAAMGLAQLKKCDALTAKRRDCVHYYREQLKDLPLSFQSEIPEIEHAHHLFPVVLDLAQLSVDRDQILQTLQASGVGCAVHFIPIHFHPFYQRQLDYTEVDLPQSSRLGKSMLSLPLYPDLTREDQDYVISVLSQVLHQYRR